ncbi:MAG: BatA domain-containing protein [Planctomycetes bacterium]|nr:BatA domain-containing protein [Planctomycetota bacterium]
MSYLLPSFLPSLALASIPGILYLLFRRRRNDVDWGATYVLKLTLQSKSRQNFWKQMAILALRTLFLALLVLGFARPFLRRDERGAGPQAYPHGPGTLHRIVLFDNSQSMTALHESVTRADAARAVLRDLMLSTLAGDTFHLVLLCPEKPDDTDLPVREYSCPIPERKVQECQSGLGLVPASAELEAGLRKAKELFSGLSSTNRQLILLSDLTRKDFPSLAGYPPLGEALNSLKVQFAALFLGKASARNLALESLTFGTDLLLRGQPTHLHLTVMNYSEMPSTEGFLSLLVDGKPFMEMPCALSPNQRKTFEFPFVPEGSAHRIEARLGEDAYAPDNHLERSVDVRDRLRVLVVRRDEPAPENPFEADTEFLERALRLPERVIKEGPLKEQQFDEGTLWIRRQHGLSTGPASRSESDLAYQIGYTVSWSSLPRSQVTSTELERQDLLLFSEIDRLGEPIRRSLVSFLRRGGSLLAGLGPRVEAEAFNETFHDILPYALDRPFRDPFEKPNYERFLNIQPTDLTLPLLKEFERPVNGTPCSSSTVQGRASPFSGPPLSAVRGTPSSSTRPTCPCSSAS